MVSNNMKDILAYRSVINTMPISTYIEALFATTDTETREFIMTLLNYTLQARQLRLMHSDEPFEPYRAKGAADSKQLIILAGIDGTGKSTFYQVAHDLFEDTFYIEKKHHSFYKACEKYFASNRSLTIEAKLSIDDADLLPIIRLAREYDYEVVLVMLDVLELDLIHTRLADRDNGSPYTLAELAARQFYSESLLNDLITEANRYMVINNTERFEVFELSW